MSDTSQSIMTRLREETRELHSLAESRPLQQQIAKGEVDRGRFAAYLGQLYLIHNTLESALQREAAAHPAVGKLATADRMRVPDLIKDLQYFRLDRGDLEPNPATSRFMEAIEDLRGEHPVALLGALYVVEGSTNGGKFLAKVLRRAWNSDGDGLSYLDPYGDDQQHKWAAFKRDMDDATFDEDQENAIVHAAHRTFQAIADVSDEVARDV